MKLLATGVVLVLLAVSAVSAAAAAPQPDAAPQAPAVSPDPAPGAVQETPPAEQAPPAPPAQTQARAATPAPRPAHSAPPAPRRESKPKGTDPDRQTSAPWHRANGEVAKAQASKLLQIRSLLPEGAAAGESSSHLVLIAAGALLALVLASGSMVSVASRAMKGQLR